MAKSASDVGAEVARTLGSMSNALIASRKTALREAGTVAKPIMMAGGRSVLPSMRFRNMRGATLSVRTRVTDEALVVSPVGPWGILEPGARPHSGDAWHRGRRPHPGTRDTSAWSTGQAKTYAALGQDIPDTIGDAVEDAFNG